MAGSTITREAAVQESIGWNRRHPVPDDPEERMSDLSITTNEIETYLDIIPYASVFNAKYDGCATKAGTAASWAYQFKVDRH